MAYSILNSPLDLALAATVVFSTLLTIFLLTLPSQYAPRRLQRKPASRRSGEPLANSDEQSEQVSVQVVVLGDIGRSPRMQYHAISLAKHGAKVDLIGYEESEPHKSIINNPAVAIFPLSPAPKFLQTSNRLLFLLLAPLKVLWQIGSLYYTLGYRTAPAKWMLVQNPPSIPSLAIAQFMCFVRNTRLVIDWHNFGYSILALKLGSSHPLVLMSRVYENVFGRSASAHFAVTEAMAKVIGRATGVTALTLHDRPPEHFQPLNSQQRAAFLGRLAETRDLVQDIQHGQWKLIVSSTSWTADEDFSLLLDALVQYSAQAATGDGLPNIIAIITGKGPQKDHYLRRIAELSQQKKLSNVIIKTAWLTMEDYALLLGAADIGISLHTSSSGVDLPMKVVDMFGTGLPVLGWNRFEAWPELVQEDLNGKGFQSSGQLARLLVQMLSGDGSQLSQLREGALKECSRRWDDEWDPVAGKLFQVVR